MRATPTCQCCGEVIGVYEPMVVLAEGRARTTSRAAEPDVAVAAEQRYHDACYTQAHGEHRDAE
jgi:hypothetical protein